MTGKRTVQPRKVHGLESMMDGALVAVLGDRGARDAILGPVTDGVADGTLSSGTPYGEAGNSSPLLIGTTCHEEASPLTFLTMVADVTLG